MPDIIYRYKNKDGRWVYFNENQIGRYPDAIVYMTLDNGQTEDLGTVHSLGMAYDNYEPDLTAEQRLNRLGIFFNETTRRWEGGNGRKTFTATQEIVGNPEENPTNQLTREQRLARMGFRFNGDTGRWERGGTITPQQRRASVSITQQSKIPAITQTVKESVPARSQRTIDWINATSAEMPVLSNAGVSSATSAEMPVLSNAGVSSATPAEKRTIDLVNAPKTVDLVNATIENSDQLAGPRIITEQSKFAAPVPDRLNRLAAEDFIEGYNPGAKGRLLSWRDQYNWETSSLYDAAEQIATQLTNKLAAENGGFDADTYDRVFDDTYNTIISSGEEMFGNEWNSEESPSAIIGTEDDLTVRRQGVIDALSGLGRELLTDEAWVYLPTPEGSYAIPSSKIREINDQASFQFTPEFQQSLGQRIGDTVSKLFSARNANATALLDNEGNVVNITTPALKQPVGAAQNEYSVNQQKMISDIRNVAQKYGVDENLLLNIAWNESRFNPNAKSSKSSAKGLFQITNPTWRDLVKNFGSTHGITSSGVYDPVQNATGSALLLQGHQKAYEKAGIPVNNSTLYMGNFLGRTGAINFLNEYYNGDPNKIAATSMVKAAEANPTLFYKDYDNYGTKYPRTYAELFDLMGGKLTRTF